LKSLRWDFEKSSLAFKSWRSVFEKPAKTIFETGEGFLNYQLRFAVFPVKIPQITGSD
jgi:hypothetical protein